jgi:hypothetical protein
MSRKVRYTCLNASFFLNEISQSGVQFRVMQYIKEEHLAEPIADFFKFLTENLNQPDLADNVLRFVYSTLLFFIN